MERINNSRSSQCAVTQSGASELWLKKKQSKTESMGEYTVRGVALKLCEWENLTSSSK